MGSENVWYPLPDSLSWSEIYDDCHQKFVKCVLYILCFFLFWYIHIFYFICILLSFSPLYLYSLKCCLILSYLITVGTWPYQVCKYLYFILGANVCCESESGSILFEAAASGNPDIVSLLLDNGADPNLPLHSGHLPIHRVAYHGHVLWVI